MEIDAYDGTVAYVDEQAGRLIEALAARQLLDNTLLVVVSDHGEQFGEHGLLSHGNSLYLPLLHVPLVISLPGRVPAGVRVTTPATLADLPATVIDLIGVAPPVTLPGRSLRRFWAKSSNPGDERPILSEVSRLIRMAPWLPAARGDMQSLVVGDLHYIRGGDGQEELYNLETDPREAVNLGAQNSSELASMRAGLEAAFRPAAGPAANSPTEGSP